MLSKNPGSEAVMKRYYTVDEVNALVPELEERFGTIMQLRSQLKALYQRLDAKGFAPADDDFEPATPGAPSEVVRDRAAFKGLVEVLRGEIAEVARLGCQIKDVEIGLVDWFAQAGEREVLLCWRFGEKQVAFWHDLESGFSGRRPVSELR
jgi:hypothetical protein